MLLKLTTPVPSSRLSLSKKLKSTIHNIRGSSQTPTLRKKFSPHLNKSFNCYEEPSTLPSYSRQSPSILRDSVALKKTKNRLRITSKSSTTNIFSQAKAEMSSKNYLKALDILNKLLQEDSSNIEVLYSRGVCLMHLKLHSEAISDLKRVQEFSPMYDPQLYIALYMSYMYVNDYPSAMRILTQGIKQYPSFTKALLLRGQMLNKLKKFDRALRDFKKSEDPEAYLHMAESWKGKEQFEKALQSLENAAKNPGTLYSALLEKAKIFYRLKRFEESEKELEIVIDSQENNYSALYYKAKVLLKKTELASSGLLLEQVIQNSYDISLTTRAICKLALIKIKEKDFYGALHTLHRTFGKMQSKKKLALYHYTEGVISLMKRKFIDGISLLTGLIEENILKEYTQSCYVYRAYGHYAKSEYLLAIKDYKSSLAYGELDKASEFNFLISQVVGLCGEKNYKKAWVFLKQVTGQFPKNPMPEICQICLILTENMNDSKLLKKASRVMETAMKRRTDSEMLFIKAFIQYLQGEYEKSYACMKESIDKAEENVASHYIMRGFTNVALKVYSEAVQDFTIALQLDENISEIYPFRGVCAYLSEDYSLALDDFLNYSNSMKTSARILSAKLLMFTACYTEALQILTKGPSSDEILILKAYCLLMNSDFEGSLDLLYKVKAIETSDDLAYISDISAGTVSAHGFGSLFHKKYALWIRGVALMYEKRLAEAIEVFQDVLEIMHSTEGDLFSDNIIIEEENCEVLYNIALCNTMSKGEVIFI